MGDKKIFIVPSLEIVVVRHGEPALLPAPGAPRFNSLIWDKLMPAIAPK